MADRLGYLERVVDALDTASPDSLHGAAHFAPLTGLELPILDLLADLNDATIQAGQHGDLGARDRVRELTRQRVEAEIDRMRLGQATETATGAHDDVLDRLRWAGEAMTAEIALDAAPTQLAATIAARVRALVEDTLADAGDRRVTLARAIADAIDGNDVASARQETDALLAELAIPPLATATD